MAKSAKDRANKRAKKEWARGRRINKEMRTAAARQAVFGTFEICEEILDHLGFHDLFSARRASRMFFEVIAESKPLQRKHFLLLEKAKCYHVYNPRKRKYNCAFDSVSKAHHCQPVRFNPVLTEFVEYGGALQPTRARLSPSLHRKIPATDIIRSTFIFQPPSKRVALDFQTGTYSYWGIPWMFFLECDSGIMLGMVLGQLQKIEQEASKVNAYAVYLHLCHVAYEKDLCQEGLTTATVKVTRLGY